MNETNKPAKELESIGDAARRLIGVMDARRGSGRLGSPEEFASPDEWSLVPGEKRGNGDALEVRALKPFPRIALPGSGFRLGFGRDAKSKCVRLCVNANRDDDDWLW